MAAGADVKDILNLQREERKAVTKDDLFSVEEKKTPKPVNKAYTKKPEGMARELWGLLCNDGKDSPPIIPTDSNQGYKQLKAKIGRSKVRPWKWTPFTNPARTDGAIFYHWRRAADEPKEYPFARFNKQVDVVSYSDIEYQQHLSDENWTKKETDYLLDMCRKFDLRFVIMCDRWDLEQYQKRSIEDLKERYYGISNTLLKMRSPGSEAKIKMYDAEHERRRKRQLEKLMNRTDEQLEEEEQLQTELKKIETRKKEREKKTQDLQKLITQAESNADKKKMKGQKKGHTPQVFKGSPGAINYPEGTGIKFAEFKGPGVTMRSMKMKLPQALGQRKMKAIEQVLDELGIEPNPVPTEEVVTNFNELRQDIVLLYELKIALATCEYEIESLKHQYETLAPGQKLDITTPAPLPPTALASISTELKDSPQRAKKLSETIEVVDSATTPTRKRRAAIEQTNVMKKLKQKL